MDGWLAWALALLIYPGLLFGLLAAWLGEALLALTARRRVRGPGEIVALLRRPASGVRSSWGPQGEALLAGWGVAAPLLALLLLPVPAHPLILIAQANEGTPLTGSTTAILLLAGSGPLALAALGLGSAHNGAQIGGARLARQAGLALLPLGLALAALATAGASADLGQALAGMDDAPLGWLVRVMAVLALLVALPALGQWPPADATGPDPVFATSSGFMAGLNGPPLFFARLGVLLQRVVLLALLVLLAVPGAAASRTGPGSLWLFLLLLPLPVVALGLVFAGRPSWPPDRAAALSLLAGLPAGLLALLASVAT